MKYLISFILLLTAFVSEAQLQTPSASPNATVSTVVGLTDIKVTYARPKMKGRKIFGEGYDFLVPYGKLWRTGANNGTKISFSDDVKVEGIAVSKGDYLIFSIPGAQEWTISLYNDISIGGNVGAYDKSKEAASFKVKSERLTERVEMFTIDITDINDASNAGKIQLAWENTSVKFNVSVDFDTKVMKSIEAATQVNPSVYGQAATYYYENGKDLKKALEWINIACNANADAYWLLLTKARIQKALGDKTGAAATANLSKAAATKANNADYIKMNDDLLRTLK